jgi:hypothetical protein
MVAVSFIGGGNRSTWRKPPTTCCKSIKNLMLYRVHLHIRGIRTDNFSDDSQWLYTRKHTYRWISPGPRVSSTNKTDQYDIVEILLKVALNTIKQTNNIFRQEIYLFEIWAFFIWSSQVTDKLHQHNVVHFALFEIRTHNISGDEHWLHW